MAQKIIDLPTITSVDTDDTLLVYDTVTEVLSRATPKTVTDSAANIIHTDISNEIETVTTKQIPHASDVLLIEDSEDAFSKKKIPLSTLGGGAGGIPESPVDGEEYLRKDGGWVALDDVFTISSILWEAAGPPPEFQLCFADNVPITVTYSSYPITDPKITVNLALGEITVIEDINHINIHVNLQVIRTTSSPDDVIWGLSTEVNTGAGWGPYPNSTRYFTFNKESTDSIMHFSFSSNLINIAAGTKFRLCQITDDASVDIGLVSSKPFALLSQSSGITLYIITR